MLSEGARFLKIPRKSKTKTNKKTYCCPPPPLELGGNCPPCPHPPPCSAAYDLNYDPAGGCDGNH